MTTPSPAHMYLRLPVSVLSLISYQSLIKFLLPGISQDQVRRELADAEEDAVARGTLQLHDTGPSACLSMGLMIEESQYVVSDSNISFPSY